jgi:glucuronate isomerase
LAGGDWNWIDEGNEIMDTITNRLLIEISKFPILDPHSHIDPFAPAAQSLEDLLGYHYYTELAHSAGMSKDLLQPDGDPRKRCRAILNFIERFDNTVQYSWLLEIARTFLGFDGERLTSHDADSLFNAAQTRMGQPDWADQVIAKTNLEAIFLTNSFDDRLEGFDVKKYVPCLRTDDLVFQGHDPSVRRRLRHTTGIDVTDGPAWRNAIDHLFQNFKSAGARACAISLPPDFAPSRSVGVVDIHDAELNRRWLDSQMNATPDPIIAAKVFWMLAEACRQYQLPFDLMIGVNRRVYAGGVYQGQDLFDQRTSLIQYADVFNTFPEVPFCISVLTSSQNQELTSYAWIFPNVRPMGHWWYSNVPCYIEHDLRARLTAVPKSKLIGYYSDAYKLEFVLPKFNMYRRSLAKVLAEEFVATGRLSEYEAVELARLLLCDNVATMFSV